MPISKLLGVTSATHISNPYKVSGGENFVKDAFNFGAANPNRPETRVVVNALGDPVKGLGIYCLA